MKPYFETKNGKLYHGDCLEVMQELDVKADLCLTDPPYGIGEDGKKTTQEAYLLKPQSLHQKLGQANLSIKNNLNIYANHQKTKSCLAAIILLTSYIALIAGLVWDKENNGNNRFCRL